MLNCNLASFEGGNIRLVQMGVALQHLNHVISEVAPGAPLVFCGDFNSSPNSGNCTPVAMLQQPLLHSGKIPCPDGPLDGSEFSSFCYRQVYSSWSQRLRFLWSTQTGAARGRRSPVVWSCSLRSPRCWVPATNQSTPTMWEDSTAAWTTFSYNQRACRYRLWQS